MDSISKLDKLSHSMGMKQAMIQSNLPILGYGCRAVVAQLTETQVLKIVCNRDDDAYDAFIKEFVPNVDSWHNPVIYETFTLSNGNEAYILEKLNFSELWFYKVFNDRHAPKHYMCNDLLAYHDLLMDWTSDNFFCDDIWDGNIGYRDNGCAVYSDPVY